VIKGDLIQSTGSMFRNTLMDAAHARGSDAEAAEMQWLYS